MKILYLLDNPMNNADRFTDTIENYIKYRPSYPPAFIELLRSECNLTKQTIIADIGSGTGLLTKMLLMNGNEVFGVEPNKAMRVAADIYLQAYPKFHNIDGSAEASTLANHSVDLITAGTAFHWFDPLKTKQEFLRILRPPGWVVLVWNVRNTAESKLLQDYETLLLEYGKDYRGSKAQEFNQTAVKEFFSPYEMKQCTFKNNQQFDWEGFKGRLLSTSYSLRPSDKRFEAMIDALKQIYEHYQVQDKIEFKYLTEVYYGHLLS